MKPQRWDEKVRSLIRVYITPKNSQFMSFVSCIFQVGAIHELPLRLFSPRKCIPWKRFYSGSRMNCIFDLDKNAFADILDES
jgi:hypothetical protein